MDNTNELIFNIKNFALLAYNNINIRVGSHFTRPPRLTKMNNLTKEQTNILDNFIQDFLPPRGNKRKNSGNELDYVTTALDKVFKQNFGFNLNRQIILNAFEILGYDTFEKEGNIDHENKTFKPANNGNVKTKIVESGNFQIEAPFTYIDISADTIRHLMKTTAQLPENTNSKTVQKTEELKNKIQKFKTKNDKE